MTPASPSDVTAKQTERALVSDLFHAISQPLTALECGLEVSLRRDRTAAQLRARVETALVAAKLLHQRLLEARVLQDAGEPGDTSVPMELESLLLQLQEDFLPIAESAKVSLAVQCETVMVRGNEARFRNGFFYLFEFLLRTKGRLRTGHSRRGPGIGKLTPFDIYCPLYPLAEWVAYNWWFLQSDTRPSTFLAQDGVLATPVWRSLPAALREHHSIRASGDGFAWPDLLIVPDDSETRLVWETTAFIHRAGRSVSSPVGTTGSAASRSSGKLEIVVTGTLTRLAEQGVAGTVLEKEWSAIRADRSRRGLNTAVPPPASAWTRIRTLSRTSGISSKQRKPSTGKS